jgi:3-oxoacyl-[acyl-carrier-protein] synthase I
VAQEKATRASGEPQQALGLTAAIRAALADARATIQDVALFGTDISGERYGFHELALAYVRLKPRRTGIVPHFHAAESVGEIGAGIGPLTLAYFAFMLRAGGAPGPGLLFTGGSENGGRAAVFIGEATSGR